MLSCARPRPVHDAEVVGEDKKALDDWFFSPRTQIIVGALKERGAERERERWGC